MGDEGKINYIRKCRFILYLRVINYRTKLQIFGEKIAFLFIECLRRFKVKTFMQK